ncbi:hypothetical protein Tco_0719705 [Tanacetum coccineum]
MVPRANILVIKKNNQRVASDAHITDTMLRFAVEILRHHTLYNPVSLTATVLIIHLHQFWTTINHNKNNHTYTFEQDNHTFTLTPGLLKTILQMPPPDPNNTYIQPSSESQILKFIRTLGCDEDPKTKLIVISKMVASRLHQPWRDLLSVLNRYLTGKDSSWDTDEFEWQRIERSPGPSKMSKLLYTRFTKLIIDYLLSLNKSTPRRSDSKLHSSQDDHPITKILSTTNGEYKLGMEVLDAMISDEIKKNEGQTDKAVADMYNKWGQKLKGPTVEDLAVQSLLDLQKGSKANDATIYSSSSYKSEESASETDDADEFDMDFPMIIHMEMMMRQGASEVPIRKHVDVLATKTLMQEMFLDEYAHHIPSLPVKKISYQTTIPQPSSLQAKAKKLMQKAKKNMRKFNFKKAVAQKFREYDQKLKAYKFQHF